MDNKILSIMKNEYMEACADHYEERYGEKMNVSYTLVNNKTGKSVFGDVSGSHETDGPKERMRIIEKMMKEIFGDQALDELKQIRRNEREKQKTFFLENPQYVVYVSGNIQ